MKRSIFHRHTLLLAVVLLLSCAVAATAQTEDGLEFSPPTPDELAGAPADATSSDSGLAWKVLRVGDGDRSPANQDQVIVHYTGWTADGETFDSTWERGKPARLPLDRLIRGWTEGLEMMVEGEARRLWIPAALAYEGNPKGPQGNLVFDVELIRSIHMPPAPDDVAAPPSDATATKSGLYSKVLATGTGTESPTKKSKVTVHYTGWTTEGEMFDSTLPKEKSATFGLRDVIKGWTEGVQLMVVGEKRRFWIPEKLAYKGQEGAPAGMLVFDIELLSFE